MQLLNKAKHIFLSLILLLCFNSLAHGFHIVGGEMYYECIGNNQYVFHMKVYKDCFANIRNPNDPVAPFDRPATLTVYSNSDLRFNVINVPITDSIRIPPNIPLDCIVNPPVVCVEETEYTFGPVTLPFDPGGYTVTYQRCCRNSEIQSSRTSSYRYSRHQTF